MPETRKARRRVLVVDDNALFRELAIRCLKGFDCDIDIATNGREAVDAWKRRSYDLILMDLCMPGLDGFAATREIRGRETGQRVPIIAVTSNAAADTRPACTAAGMNDFVAKPYAMATLQTVVRRYLPHV